MVDGKWNKFRDDVDHTGKKIDWGKWAITGNDPSFGGTGNPDTGEHDRSAIWRSMQELQHETAQLKLAVVLLPKCLLPTAANQQGGESSCCR